MWPFKKKEESEPSRPQVSRKTKTLVESSRVVGLAAILQTGAAKSVYGKGPGLEWLGERRSLYESVNPGMTASIPSSNFLIVFSRSSDISEMLVALTASGEGQRFGRTSKVVQVGLMSTIAAQGGAIRIPVALVTFVEIAPQEPETIEILDLEKGSIEFVANSAKITVDKGTEVRITETTRQPTAPFKKEPASPAPTRDPHEQYCGKCFKKVPKGNIVCPHCGYGRFI